MPEKPTADDLRLVADTLRGLAMDGTQSAKSGHPGMPMGMADVAAVLWLRYLNHCPDRPDWPGRDRFVLSAGHGSMLLYGLLHLSGYDLPLDELRRFRQWNSRTPGHPEYGETPGVETTTGPLGQGCGNAVGMALAERMLAARFNTPDFQPADHMTYVIASDGDMMEGLSHEAFSLAGHLGLSNLVVFYDYNHITIEGATDLAYSDDVKRRFQGYHWNVLEIDAHDVEQVDKAVRKARREKTRPTLVICRAHIGYKSPNKQDSAAAHGEPLGEDEVRAVKEVMGFPPDQAFYVPERVRALFDARRRTLKRRAAAWDRKFRAYADAAPDRAAAWTAFHENRLPEDLAARLPNFDPGTPVATRNASGKVIQALADAVPQLVGGSADLAPSTKTLIDGSADIGPGAFEGRNFRFGIREHAMAAMLNGIMLHGGFRAFGATFFVFADYCRPSLRLACIMKLPVIYVFTHDSFNVGEDGPTHEPVEQLASLRAMPNMTCIRPSDATETAAAWLAALRNTTGPTALLLTRQKLDVIDRSRYPSADGLARGAYILWESGAGAPELILIASGSEVGMTLRAAEQLAAETGRRIRVVSMPSWELFDAQPADYRERVLPAACRARLAVEAGVRQGWDAYLGPEGRMLAMTRYGASAPYAVLQKEFGFTAENIAAEARRLLDGAA
ncbi:MAG: transketolase [Lentisphaerae bacterium]|nr:transketolase [Lentisphaerota bacterium]